MTYAFQISLEDFKKEVVRQVKGKLNKFAWFNGVCLDDIEDFYPDKIKDAVSHAESESFYWDGKDWRD